MPKKLTTEFVKAEFKKVGFDLLTEEYKNNYQKLEYVCDRGHRNTITWSNFQQGRCKCSKCFLDDRRLSIEFIRSEFKKKDYQLLTTEYKNSQQKLEYICSEDHKGKMSWGSFQQGHECGKCFGNKKLTIEFIRSEFEKIKYTLLTKEYKNSRQKLEYICPRGHKMSISWGHFQQGERCPICVSESQKREGHYNWRGGISKLGISSYNTYAPQIEFCEEVRRDPDNFEYLQVRCTESSCREWFNPTIREVRSRINALNSISSSENRFYCSKECKQVCVLYRRVKYPKGFKVDNLRFDQKEWADLVKERDGYTCRRCGATEDLVAHHFEGIYVNPLMSADIDMGITLCKICDKLAHKDIGCRPIDLTRKNLCV